MAAKEEKKANMNPQQQMAELFKTQAVTLLDRGTEIVTELEVLTANQQKLRANTENEIKQDESVKGIASEIEGQLKTLIEVEDERVHVLIEDILSDALSVVKESAKNYLEGHASAEAKEIRTKQEQLRTDYDKAKELFISAKNMAEYNEVSVADLAEFPSKPGGRKGGSTGTTGTRGPRVRDYAYHYERNGTKEPTYDNLSRALWYSSAKSGGAGQDGRLSVAEFKKLFREQNPELSDEVAGDWDVMLPNNVKLSFRRYAKPEVEATTPITKSE